jgi:hypothetical protein
MVREKALLVFVDPNVEDHPLVKRLIKMFFVEKNVSGHFRLYNFRLQHFKLK